MPKYLVSARNTRWQQVTEWVEAPTADAAVEAARDRGYTEIVLHTEDVMAAARPASEVQGVTPQDHVTILYFRGYLDRVNFYLRKLYPDRSIQFIVEVIETLAGRWVRKLHLKTTLLVTVGYLIYVVCRYVIRGKPPLRDTVDLIVLVSALVIALGAPFLGMARAYRRVLEHAMWGRWNELLSSLRELGPIVPAHERALRKAQALAGLGRLDEGLAVFQPFETGSEIPAWFYVARLAEIYAAAGEWNKAVTMRDAAARLAPDNPALLIDFALAILRVRENAGRARELLDQALTHPITPISAPYVAHAEGLLALEQGHAREATKHLQSALDQANEYLIGKPVGRFEIDILHADLALAYARLGEANQALEHFRRAEPRLRARPWFHLLERCEKALSIPESVD
jgi:hypothetical protein